MPISVKLTDRWIDLCDIGTMEIDELRELREEIVEMMETDEEGMNPTGPSTVLALANAEIDMRGDDD